MQGPLNLEASCFRQQGRFVIHLLNHTVAALRLYAGSGGAVAEEGVPCRDVGVALQLDGQAPCRVYLGSSQMDLPYEVKEGRVVLSVPQVDLHEIVVVEYDHP